MKPILLLPSPGDPSPSHDLCHFCHAEFQITQPVKTLRILMRALCVWERGDQSVCWDEPRRTAIHYTQQPPSQSVGYTQNCKFTTKTTPPSSQSSSLRQIDRERVSISQRTSCFALSSHWAWRKWCPFAWPWLALSLSCGSEKALLVVAVLILRLRGKSQVNLNSLFILFIY